jgi:hypothetical protein
MIDLGEFDGYKPKNQKKEQPSFFGKFQLSERQRRRSEE